MPSSEIQANVFTHLSVFDSPKGSSNTFKTHKNSLCFKRRYLIIYNYCNYYFPLIFRYLVVETGFYIQSTQFDQKHKRIEALEKEVWITSTLTN